MILFLNMTFVTRLLLKTPNICAEFQRTLLALMNSYGDASLQRVTSAQLRALSYYACLYVSI